VVSLVLFDAVSFEVLEGKKKPHKFAMGQETFRLTGYLEIDGPIRGKV
jgi:hypothetical protein